MKCAMEGCPKERTLASIAFCPKHSRDWSESFEFQRYRVWTHALEPANARITLADFVRTYTAEASNGNRT